MVFGADNVFQSRKVGHADPGPSRNRLFCPLWRRAGSKRRRARRQATVKELARNLGFSSVQYVSTVFKRIAGVSPGSYRP